MRIRLPKTMSAPCVLITAMRASPYIVGSVAAMPTDMTRAGEVEWIFFGTVFEPDAPKTKTPAHDRPGQVDSAENRYSCNSAPNTPVMRPPWLAALKSPKIRFGAVVPLPFNMLAFQASANSLPLQTVVPSS